MQSSGDQRRENAKVCHILGRHSPMRNCAPEGARSANPESRSTTSGFRVQPCGLPRNDEKRKELHFKRVYETIV